MQRRRPTVADLLAERYERQRTNIFITSIEEARAVEQAHLDMLVVGDDTMSVEIREAAPTVFITAALAYGQHVTTEDYLREAFRMRRLGADAVYCAASLQTVSRLAAEGLPVVGHIGFIPTHRTWTGGFKAVGRTAQSALRVWNQALALQDAGAFAAEIEIVPEAVATAIAQRCSLFLMSMGSGAGCAAQYLFSMDILGAHDGHYPRHSKTYRDFRTELARLHDERVGAYEEYRRDVETGAYPEEGHKLGIDDDELAKFLSSIESAG